MDVYRYSITSRNNAPISSFGCGIQCKSKYPWCIIQVKKTFSNIKKIKNLQIFTKSVENAKICNISRRYLKISPCR
ncbi:Uncharacterized protein FWK35_00015746 [Aphis craccivora]|uniref:Uncharacterized protein n=1 Tax=Aphis craccivora TaxID=307492 RepID=A0A6G0ZLI4_APHCR|nr:Uncharacterized protein FWK35_00015746 [Aphis craccivora]